MAEPTIHIHPSPFVLVSTASALPGLPSITKSLHVPLPPSPIIQIGQPTQAGPGA